MRELTDAELERSLSLLDSCAESHTFKFTNLLCNGIVVNVVKEYVTSNPSKKFRTWLIDNGHVIIEY